MNVHQSEALTLKTYPFEEAHRIVVFLTRDFGQLRGIAHGARKAKSRFGSSLELLTHNRVIFYRKEHQELAVIQNCEIITPHPAYELSWELNLHFGYFAELLLEFSREQAENERLFRLSLAVLDSALAAPVPTLARYFELWLLRFEGILPSFEQALPPDTAEAARTMMRLHPSSLTALDSNHIDRLEKFCGRIIESHLEKSLKSRRLLKQLL